MFKSLVALGFAKPLVEALQSRKTVKVFNRPAYNSDTPLTPVILFNETYGLEF